jgi:hypothetical protein
MLPAAAAGVASSSQLTVQFSYQGGTRFGDASADNRTAFDLSASGGLFTVDTCSASNPRVLTNTQGLVGACTLVFRFTNESVATSINITVVQFTQLIAAATPFPAHPGSSAEHVTALSRIGGTSVLVYEHAIVQLSMRLTDNTVLPLIGNVGATLSLLNEAASGPATMPPSVRLVV